jgi:RNA polymerase sigma-70 factor (sigma-E family)
MAEAVEFATFVRVHTTALLGTAILLTGNRAAAEDLLQDTFVRLYPRWDRVAEAELPLAYVRRSLTNNFLNGLRGKNNAAKREVLQFEAPEAMFEPDIAGQITDADLVRELLGTLPYRQRAVLVLRFLQDLSDAEIAVELHMRPGSVRSIVSRSLAALRAQTERRDRTDPGAPMRGRAS